MRTWQWLGPEVLDSVEVIYLFIYLFFVVVVFVVVFVFVIVCVYYSEFSFPFFRGFMMKKATFFRLECMVSFKFEKKIPFLIPSSLSPRVLYELFTRLPPYSPATVPPEYRRQGEIVDGKLCEIAIVEQNLRPILPASLSSGNLFIFFFVLFCFV